MKKDKMKNFWKKFEDFKNRKSEKKNKKKQKKTTWVEAAVCF